MSVIAFHRVRTGSLLLGTLALFVLGGVSHAQVSTSSLLIGGSGATGCGDNPTDPPTIEGGKLASGEVVFNYDKGTQVLTLVVSNTSAVVAGEDNPVIRRIYLNLPQLACSGAILIGQAGAGGAVPNFTMTVDPDLADGVGSINANCFGRFGILLQDQGNLDGSIANPLATQLPAGSMTIGPVTFQIQIIGASEAISAAIASTYSSSLSYNPTGEMIANAVFLFNPGDLSLDDSEDFVGNIPVAGGGSPAGWIVGDLMVGQTITIVKSAPPTWFAWLVASPFPGPLLIGGILWPIGEDFVIVDYGPIPAVGYSTTTLTIPNWGPELGGLTVYGLVVSASPGGRTISIGEQFSAFVEF